jgi:predicted metal-dependent hydrolase
MLLVDKVFFLLIGVLGVFHMRNSHLSEVEYVKSKIDGRKYVVKSVPDKQKAADLLAKINRRLILLVEHMETHLDEFVKEDVDRLVANFNPDNISEGTDKANYTSYSINKGEKIIFCLRSRDEKESIIDINTLMYVAVHELGHLMTAEIGHTPSFWSNFKILLEEAVDLGLYTATDYKAQPVKYCGMKIKSTILK